MEVVVTDVVRDEGSVVLLMGLTTDGSDRVITFAADRRPAAEIAAALALGEDVLCSPEPWQIVRDQPMPTFDDQAGV
jgi:hypothetical protein